MRILIVGAMDVEIQFLKSKMDNYVEENKCGFVFFVGKIKENDVILVKSGIGKTSAGMLIGVAKSSYDFDCVINVGVAGGISPLKTGDIVICDKYIYGDVDVTVFGDKYKYGQMAGCPRYYQTNIDYSKIIEEEIKVADICTSDAFTTSYEHVKYLIDNYFSDLNILCFDMESTGFAQACYFADVPFLAIRSISDIIGGQAQAEEYDSNVDESSIKVNNFLLNIINNL